MMRYAGPSSSMAGGPSPALRETWGGRILEIGAGTGLSFADYDATTEITGIDISGPMIARARERTKNGRYPFVTSRGLGLGAWWCRVDRAAQGQPTRRLHAGPVSAHARSPQGHGAANSKSVN